MDRLVSIQVLYGKKAEKWQVSQFIEVLIDQLQMDKRYFTRVVITQAPSNRPNDIIRITSVSSGDEDRPYVPDTIASVASRCGLSIRLKHSEGLVAIC
jgi:hypothetical protein